jgi:uncharacterized membrane protein
MECKDRILGVLLVLLVVILCGTALLWIWTAWDAAVIRGLQGRYFVPVLLLLFLSVGRWQKPRLPWDMDKLTVTAAMGLTYLEMLSVLQQIGG